MQERRETLRIAPKGAVTLRSGEYSQHGRLANISRSGIFIATKVGVPDRLLAREASLEIRLDAGAAEWLTVSGRIARIAPAGVAITFDTPNATLAGMLHDASSASDASLRLLSVVLIDNDERRRQLMSEGFRAAGCTVLAVGSPLEAIVRLGELSFEPNVIAVSDSYQSDDARQMRDFISSRHPDAQLITIGDELLEPEGIDYWLSSADPARDLAHRVRDVLVRWEL